MYTESVQLSEERIKSALQYCYFYCNDPRNDGFTGWAQKQKVHEILMYAERLLKNMPTYAGEEEWLEQKRTEMAFEVLRK